MKWTVQALGLAVLAALSAAPAKGAPVTPTLYVDSNTAVYTIPPGGGSPTLLTPANSFTNARDIAFGPDRNLYVADFGKGLVDRVDPFSGAVAPFIAVPNAYGLTWHNGNLFVSQFASPNGSISQYSPSGTFINTVVSGLSRPTDFTFGPDGNLYVSEAGAHRVDKVTGGVPSTFVDLSGQNSGFATPRGLVFQNGLLYIADSASINFGGGKIYTANAADGSGLTTFASGLGPDGGPKGLLFDANGNLYAGINNVNTSIDPLGNGFVDAFTPPSNTASTYSNFPSTEGPNYLATLPALPPAVPEPSSLALLGLGGLALAGWRRWRKAPAQA